MRKGIVLVGRKLCLVSLQNVSRHQENQFSCFTVETASNARALSGFICILVLDVGLRPTWLQNTLITCEFSGVDMYAWIKSQYLLPIFSALG